MPKNRRRNTEKSAKSIAIRTKHKVGGRKSGTGTNQMSDVDILKKLGNCRKRDRNKLRRAFEAPGRCCNGSFGCLTLGPLDGLLSLPLAGRRGPKCE
jgi:hypothetical protein